MQYSIVQYSTVQYGTVQYSTVQYSTVQHSTVQYSIVQYSTVRHSTVQYSTVRHSTVQYSTVCCHCDTHSTVRTVKYVDTNMKKAKDSVAFVLTFSKSNYFNAFIFIFYLFYCYFTNVNFLLPHFHLLTCKGDVWGFHAFHCGSEGINESGCVA